jgi:hypothetical protein
MGIAAVSLATFGALFLSFGAEEEERALLRTRFAQPD